MYSNDKSRFRDEFQLMNRVNNYTKKNGHDTGINIDTVIKLINY